MKESYRPVDGLITRIVDGQMVLVSPASGTIRVLNEIGTTVWQALKEGVAIESIVDQIATTYELSHDQAEEDVHHFLEDLRRRDLLA